MPDVTVAAQRDRFAAWVQRHAAGSRVDMRETHVSFLALTDDRVWKCKKPVRFAFIDLRTAALRRVNCERELVLNRRLAPDVYLGVVTLDDEKGAVVDHVVEMRRLPEARRLSSIVSDHERSGDNCIDAIADLLVGFHAAAATGGAIDGTATPAALTALWTANLDELQPFAGKVLDRAQLDRVAADAHRYLAGRGKLFADRIAGGRIRDGHGDLLADDVFCLADGPRILDCLEFDDRLRFADVLADVAFLAMDLERLNRTDFARRVLDRYRRGSGDDWPKSLEHLYIAYRALVRTKVACLRVADDAASAASAQALLAVTARHLEQARVRVVLIGGPPATGKSTLARALASATDWPVIRSDEVRKELAGLGATTPAAAPVDRGIYTAAASDRTYEAVLARAREHLGRGRSVILDASWSSSRRRAAALTTAELTASELRAFVCEVAPDIAAERAAARVGAAVDASDASPEIAAALRARFEPWPGATVLDTSNPVDRLVERVLAQLDTATTRS